MKNVLITNIAKADIIGIKEYIADNNISASNNFIFTLKSVFEMLCEFQNAGVKKDGIKNSEVLIYTVEKKYNIVYRIKDENIEILRVLNKYQNIFAVL